MQWSDINFSPPPRILRQFSGLWLAFFGGLACWHGLVRGHPAAAAVLGVLALTVGPLGLVRPRLVRPIYVGWMILAFPVGWVLSRVVLALVFYGVFTPLGLLSRLAGRDTLARRPQPGAASYWTPKPAPAGARSYTRQF
jgi:hypothetical protein